MSFHDADEEEELSAARISIRFKKPRLGPLLLRRAEDPEFFRQTHVVFGGTGAVGAPGYRVAQVGHVGG